MSAGAFVNRQGDLRQQRFVSSGVNANESRSCERSSADKPNLPLLLQHLEAEGRLQLDAALTIMIRGRELTAREPNVLEIATPVAIVGDLHGQFFDMVRPLRWIAR